jgi:hypothetical protein
MALTPDTRTGMTTDNPAAGDSSPGTGLRAVGLEFDSDETVDHIDRGWWDTFTKPWTTRVGRPGERSGA